MRMKKMLTFSVRDCRSAFKTVLALVYHISSNFKLIFDKFKIGLHQFIAIIFIEFLKINCIVNF